MEITYCSPITQNWLPESRQVIGKCPTYPGWQYIRYSILCYGDSADSLSSVTRHMHQPKVAQSGAEADVQTACPLHRRSCTVIRNVRGILRYYTCTFYTVYLGNSVDSLQRKKYSDRVHVFFETVHFQEFYTQPLSTHKVVMQIIKGVYWT